MRKEAFVNDLIDRIMERRHAASGTAVFLDPVVLRDIISKALEEAEAAADPDRSMMVPRGTRRIDLDDNSQ
jgi:hypothetical protein